MVPPTASQVGSAAAVQPGRPSRRELPATVQLPAASAAHEDQLPAPAAGASAAEDAATVTATPAVGASTVAAPTRTANAVAAAAAPNSFFNNQTPTLAYDPIENVVVDGHIEGDLRPVDSDSTKLTYTATTPAFGTVVVNQNGTFEYTPGPDFAGQDMFDVTV